MEKTQTPPTIGIPYFRWIDQDITQDGITVRAYEGRQCPVCQFVVKTKTDGNSLIQKHYQKNHSA